MLHRSILAGSALLIATLILVSAGCQNQAESESATAKTKDVTVEITGMSCAQGCAPRARDALATLPWAKDVKVDFDKKQGTFVAETARYDEQAILKVLKDEGFEGKILK